MSGLGDDDEGVVKPQAGKLVQVGAIGEQFDGAVSVMAVEGVTEVGEEGPWVTSGEVDQDSVFVSAFGT